MSNPLVGLHILGQHLNFREDAQGRGCCDPLDGDQVLELTLEFRDGFDELPPSRFQALDAPIQIPDMDFQIVGDDACDRRSLF